MDMIDLCRVLLLVVFGMAVLTIVVLIDCAVMRKKYIRAMDEIGAMKADYWNETRPLVRRNRNDVEYLFKRTDELLAEKEAREEDESADILFDEIAERVADKICVRWEE